MICNHCGKNIPDTSTFCGYCGSPQKIELDIEPVSVTEEENTEAPAEEVIVEEVTEVPVTPEEPEETPAEEEIEEAVIEEKEPEPVPETAVPEPEPEVTAEPAVRAENKAASAMKNAAKSFLAGFKGEEFKELLRVLIDPFSKHGLAVVPSICVLLYLLIVSWITLRHSGGFISALLGTLIACGGTMVIMLLNRAEKFSFKNIFGTSVSALVVPAIALTALCILSFVRTASVLTIELNILFVFLGITVYIISIARIASKIQPYILAVLITALVLGLTAAIFSGTLPVFRPF